MGETWQFWNRGVLKGPAVLPNSTFLAKFALMKFGLL